MTLSRGFRAAGSKAIGTSPLTASLGAIDALPGAKRHSPRIVLRKARSQAVPDWLRNHRPDKPKFTGHRRHTCGILSDIKPFDAERHYHWIIGCPHDASSECIGGHDEKGTGFGR